MSVSIHVCEDKEYRCLFLLGYCQFPPTDSRVIAFRLCSYGIQTTTGALKTKRSNDALLLRNLEVSSTTLDLKNNKLNCHVTSHAVTPVSRKQCHTLVPHLIHLPHIASTRDRLFGVLMVFTSMRKERMQLYSIILVLGEYFPLPTFILSLKISGNKLFW